MSRRIVFHDLTDFRHLYWEGLPEARIARHFRVSRPVVRRMINELECSRATTLPATGSWWRGAGSPGAAPTPPPPGPRGADRSVARDVIGRDGLAAVSSFGTESAALLKLVSDVDPAIPVLLVNTGWLFPETLAHRGAVLESSVSSMCGRLRLTEQARAA